MNLRHDNSFPKLPPSGNTRTLLHNKLGKPKGSKGIPDTVVNEEGEEILERVELKAYWRNYFKGLLNEKVESDQQVEFALIKGVLADRTDELNEEITMEEVERAVRANVDKKASGCDEIRAGFIKNPHCIAFLHALFNHCLEKGVVPSQWSRSIIVPISKKAKPTKYPNDYRGISLQSIILKTFCRILQTRLVDFLEENNLLSDEQNGYRRDRSCQDHLFVLSSVIENRRCLKQDTYACFIDFRKAFDSVDRDLLWNKLASRYGIRGRFLVALKKMYERVESCVRVDDSLTDWFEVSNGVKQGCILSPTLFSLFMEDLVQEIKDLKQGVVCADVMVSLLLFADDIVLIAPNPQNLQAMIDTVTNWCGRMGIRINTSKTKETQE